MPQRILHLSSLPRTHTEMTQKIHLFHDPNKLPSPKTVPSIGKNYSVTSIFSTYFTNSIVANGPSLSLNMMENGNNSTQSVKADYEKGGFNMN